MSIFKVGLDDCSGTVCRLRVDFNDVMFASGHIATLDRELYTGEQSMV